jgi:hypothetical protein
MNKKWANLPGIGDKNDGKLFLICHYPIFCSETIARIKTLLAPQMCIDSGVSLRSNNVKSGRFHPGLPLAESTCNRPGHENA